MKLSTLEDLRAQARLRYEVLTGAAPHVSEERLATLRNEWHEADTLFWAEADRLYKAMRPGSDAM